MENTNIRGNKLSSTNYIEKNEIIDIELNQTEILNNKTNNNINDDNDDNDENSIIDNFVPILNKTQQKKFLGIKLYNCNKPFGCFELFLVVFYIYHIINLILNLFLSSLNDNCVNHYNNKTNLNLSIYLIITSIFELLIMWLLFYEWIYLKYCKIRDKFEGIFTFLCLGFTISISEIWTIIGLVLFFSDLNYFRNNCSENIYIYIYFQMIIGILTLIPFLFGIIVIIMELIDLPLFVN